MDYIIQHSNGHKYIKRWWKNGHWNYEYPQKITPSALDVQSGIHDGQRKNMTTFEKGVHDGANKVELRKTLDREDEKSRNYGDLLINMSYVNAMKALSSNYTPYDDRDKAYATALGLQAYDRAEKAIRRGAFDEKKASYKVGKFVGKLVSGGKKISSFASNTISSGKAFIKNMRRPGAKLSIEFKKK